MSAFGPKAAESVPCGPDAGRVVESAAEYVKSGYDHVYFHQIGPAARAAAGAGSPAAS